MRTELDFLEYLERQLMSSNEMVYACWIKQEISIRMMEVKGNVEVAGDSPKKCDNVVTTFPRIIKCGGMDGLCDKCKEVAKSEPTTREGMKKEIKKDYEN